MFKIYEDLLDKACLKKEPKELQEICEILFSKGKNLRSKLIILIGSYVNIKEDKIRQLCRMIEYIHNSSLLHDDFIDRADKRRNRPAAWTQFSPEQAVLAGDYLLAQVNIYLAQEQNLKLLDITAQSIQSLARGEFLQRELYSFQKFKLEKINRVGEYKTGSLFKWCLKAPFILVNNQDAKFHECLDKIGYYFGLLYQRSDDLLDFGIGSKNDKPLLSDLKQSYYNSFAYYLIKDCSPSIENKFQKCKTISEVHELFPNFSDVLESFHNDNKKMIEATEKEIKNIQSFLQDQQRELVKELKTIPSLLYWRDI